MPAISQHHHHNHHTDDGGIDTTDSKTQPTATSIGLQIEKHNMAGEKSSKDFLDAGSSDSEGGVHSGSESDSRIKSTTTIKRGAKRQRISDFGAASDDEDSDAGISSDEDEKIQKGKSIKKKEAPAKRKTSTSTTTTKKDDDRDSDDESEGEQEKDITDAKMLKPITPAQLAEAKRKTKKTGVIYLSSIPPFMKPPKVRHLLSVFGEINRIFLVPEDPKAHKARVKQGGNKKKKFIEGWVEFVDKKKAKLCVETLNAQIVGGKIGSYYHDDMWNMKYLQGFKWGDLQAQIGTFICSEALSVWCDFIGR